MAHTQSLSLLSQTARSVPFVELRQSLSSKVAAISPYVDQLMRFILKFRSADGSETDIELALAEALANAVIHGNRENSGRRVYVTCRCYMDGEVSITVRDEGKGFDRNEVLDPTFLENLLFTHGRGIYLMKTLMDEVAFEEGGAVVRMRKNSNFGAALQRRSERPARWHDSPFSTLSTRSTVLVLSCLKTSLIWRDLASCRFWHAICASRKEQSRHGRACNRLDDSQGTFPFNRAASRFRRVRDAIEAKTQ